MGWRSTIAKAKAKHRPDLDDWEADGLFEVFPAFVNALSEDYEAFIPSQQNNNSNLGDVSEPGNKPAVIPEEIPVVLDGKTLTPQQFATEYEAKKIPTVIKSIPEGFDGGKESPEWGAQRNWGFFAMENDPEMRERAFKCGEDDDGKSIRIKLKHFLKYLQGNHDDSPLYIFDSSFDDDKLSKKLLKDYRVPSYFRDDLFGLCSESRRPPYRWFLVGPERSGTCVHIDPLATSAWNTLIHGQKRWVLFPPHVPKSIVKGKDLIRDDEDDEAIHYFMYILPRIKRKAAAACFGQQNSGPYKDFACYEFTQNPGETVFIPAGWWHAVLNLTHTVGITQNFCSARNFDEVWRKTRTGRKRLAWKWLCQLEVRYPRLAERAKTMNRRDKFVMKYDPVVMQYRKDWQKARSEQKRKQNEDSTDEEGEEKKEGEIESSTKSSKAARIAGPAPITFAQLNNTKAEMAYLDMGWERCPTNKINKGEQAPRPVSPP